VTERAEHIKGGENRWRRKRGKRRRVGKRKSGKRKNGSF